MPIDARGRERDVADRLHSAAIHLLRRARRTDPLTGILPAQLSALSVLMSGPKTLGELAAAEQVRPPTMSRLVSEIGRYALVQERPGAASHLRHAPAPRRPADHRAARRSAHVHVRADGVPTRPSRQPALVPAR